MDRSDDLPGVLSIYYGSPPETSYAGYGQALRLAGRRQKVLAIWFLKSPDYYGEEFALEPLKEVLDLFPMRPPVDYGIQPSAEDQQHKVERGLKLARESWQSREYDLIVMDEVLTCCEQGMLAWDDLITLMRERPDYMHVTLTGTACPEELQALAHTLIHFDCPRHHLQTMEPRKGFDR